MPRSIGVDTVDVFNVQLYRDSENRLHVVCEYALKSGQQVALTRQREFTRRLPAGRMNAVVALFQTLAADVSAAELA